MTQMNLQKKLVLPMMTAVLVLFAVISFFVVNRVRSLTEAKIESVALAQLQAHARSIQSFFESRSRIPITCFQNPVFIDFFRQYSQARMPLQKNDRYLSLIRHFRNILDGDSTIKSIFFASDATGEYFDEDGRYDETGYSAKSRPWWKQALQQNRMYCGNPSYDYRDSSFSTTVQMPVRDRGRFLGIGGIDILITTVNAEIEQIRYENRGSAFLVDDSGECIVFPSIRQEFWSFRKLAALDSLLKDTKGFPKLQEKMARSPKGLQPVRFKGVDCIALYQRVGSSQPYFNWRLGLLVPIDLITAPVREITFISIGVLALSALCIFLVTLYIAFSITKPLNALASRLDEMVHRRCDLTLTLPVNSNDAIGRTAENFNTLVRQIRSTLVRVLESTQTVSDRFRLLRERSERIVGETRNLSDESQKVSGISSRMIQNVDDIAKAIKRVSQFSTQSRKSAAEGESQVRDELSRMENLFQHIADLYVEMDKLSQKTESMAKAVETVREVNEQIALLSVNASIEAVRAGESGAGFAVLAEEIKSLNERTDQANVQTLKTLNAFRADVKQFGERIFALRNRMQEALRFTETFMQKFIVLQNDVSLTDQTTEEILKETSKQSESLRSVLQTLQQISATVGDIANGVSKSFEEIQALDVQMQELKSTTDAFNV